MVSRREPIYNSLSLSIAATLLLTLIMFRIIYVMYMRKTMLIKSLIVISLMSISFFLSFSVIHLFIAIMDITKTFTSSDCIIYFLKDLLMIIGKVFMYLFFIGRLYYVFHGSLFQFDYKRILYLSIFTFISALIPALMITVSVLLPINAIIHKSDKYQYIDGFYDCSDIFYEFLTPFTKNMMAAGIAIFAIMDITISIIILRLYLNRLLLLSVAYEQLKEKCGSNEDEKENTNMKRNTLFLQTAMKIFNLMALAIATSWIGVVFQGTGYGSHWLCIDIMVNTLTIFLSFSFSANIYDKLSVCCCTNCCFNGCRKLCICCCVTQKLPVHIEMMLNKKKQHRKQHAIDMSTTSNISSTDTQTPALTQQTYGSDC